MKLRVHDFRPQSGILRLPWLVLWGPVSLFGAFAPLLVLNILQFPSLLLLPFSRNAFVAWNRAIAFLVWGWWGWSFENVIGTRVTLTGDAVPSRENAIVLANHQGMSDVPVILCVALGKGRVADAKWLVKDIIKYVPGVGWGMLFLGCIFLKRNWATDEASLQRAFRRYTDGGAPFWLVSFPEGTRITPAKLALSRNYARQRGLKETTKVLLPRPSGFIASVEGLRESVQAIYSLTIRYLGPVPTLPAIIRGELGGVEVHIKRTPIAEIPRDRDGLSAWLLANAYDMDARLAAASAPSVASKA